jgi:hypothetical protein
MDNSSNKLDDWDALAKAGFETRDDAVDAMEEYVDDPCIDNHRFAWVDEPEAVIAYEEKAATGCCGSFDYETTIGGRKAVIGCNYGH